MTKPSIAVAAVALALAVPSAASAATLVASPAKGCYGTEEKVGLTGSGFTPNALVSIAVDGQTLGTARADATGAIPPGGTLTVRQPRGEKVKTVTATDTANPANVATLQLRVAAPTVGVRPRNGTPGRLLRIRANGFLRGTLRAHIVRRGSRRTVRIGRVKGRCGGGTFRKRLFSRNTRPGTYKVQFDTKRRYSRSTMPRAVYSVRIFRVLRPAAAVAPTWTLLR